VVLWMVAVGAAAMTDPVLRLVGLVGSPYNLIPTRAIESLVIMSTVWLSVSLVRRALAAEDVASAAGRCVVGGIFFGAVNAGLALALATAVRGRLGEVVAAFLLGTMFGGVFYGGPLGFVYGLSYAPLVGSVVEARRYPSRQALAGVLLWAGGWLALVGAISVGLARRPFLALSWAALLLGLEFIVFAIYLDLRCALWVRRLSEGQQPGWEVITRRWDDEEHAVAPLLRCGLGELYDGVIVSRQPSSNVVGPYRGADVETVFAAVPQDLERVVTASTRRALMGFAILFVLGMAATAHLVLFKL
jgi:hypothetical protein